MAARLLTCLIRLIRRFPRFQSLAGAEPAIGAIGGRQASATVKSSISAEREAILKKATSQITQKNLRNGMFTSEKQEDAAPPYMQE